MQKSMRGFPRLDGVPSPALKKIRRMRHHERERYRQRLEGEAMAIAEKLRNRAEIKPQTPELAERQQRAKQQLWRLQRLIEQI